MIEITKEDYLRTIYQIYEKQDSNDEVKINSVEISRILKITKPTVSRIVKKLTEQGYLNSKLYSKIEFTQKGLNEAKRVMYKHRIIEAFLVKFLSYEHNLTIHEEAHKLEHSFSDESIRRIDKILNYPKQTSKGKDIPRDWSN